MSRLAAVPHSPSRRRRRVVWSLLAALAFSVGACGGPTVPEKTPAAQAARPGPSAAPQAATPAVTPALEAAPVAPVVTQPATPSAGTEAQAAPGTLSTAPSATAGGGPEVKVALLLPLSGPNAALGHALLDAAQMALFDVGDNNVTLLPRDTGSTPDGAAQAARDVLGAGAKLILGPFFSSSVGAVAPLAQQGGVNVIAFSSDARVAAPGVFVMGFLPSTQVSRVVAYAHTKGFGQFAALVPDDAYGQAIADNLRQTAQQVGGEVVDVEMYDPAANDATAAVRQLAHYKGAGKTMANAAGATASDATAAKPAGGESSGGFDALMLPEGGGQLRALAPLLPYNNIDPSKIKLLGSGQWDDPSVAREPVLAGGWFAAPDPHIRTGFEQRFAALYGRQPPLVATLAYDATALAAVLGRSANGPDYSVGAITNPNGFSGLTGIFRFRQDGQVERGLAVLEVAPDGAKVIDPAPASFQAPATN